MRNYEIFVEKSNFEVKNFVFRCVISNFAKVKLYIYRKCHDRPFGIARPCPSCMAAIKDFGIRDIYYTTNDGYAYEKLEKNKMGGVA